MSTYGRYRIFLVVARTVHFHKDCICAHHVWTDFEPRLQFAGQYYIRAFVKVLGVFDFTKLLTNFVEKPTDVLLYCQCDMVNDVSNKDCLTLNMFYDYY